MRTLTALLAVCFTCDAGAAVAQNAAKTLEDWQRPVMVRLARGDLLRVNTDSAFVYNRKADQLHRSMRVLNIRFDSLNRAQLATISRKDSIIGLLRQRVTLADSVNKVRDSVVNAFGEITRIQNQAWDSLHSRFQALDTLTHRSVANTDQALAYAKRVRITSYLTSALAGGIIAGFGFKSGNQQGFRWSGCAIGAGLGLGLNALALKILR